MSGLSLDLFPKHMLFAEWVSGYPVPLQAAVRLEVSEGSMDHVHVCLCGDTQGLAIPFSSQAGPRGPELRIIKLFQEDPD